jgi:hypothetical protein
MQTEKAIKQSKQFPNQKRRWYNFYLSTAIVAMITASVFGLVCFSERHSGPAIVRGWPFYFSIRADPDLYPWPPTLEIQKTIDMKSMGDFNPYELKYVSRSKLRLPIDLAIGSLITILVCVIFEWRTRRQYVSPQETSHAEKHRLPL